MIDEIKKEIKLKEKYKIQREKNWLDWKWIYIFF